ncbi:multidrug efflux MFS transporter [Bacillus cytotoxicus]|uniref:Major facilitator superfamily MFS_1 n=1 Tax=Bacillus cytotoxicus TaxID=580165 RepID=A0AAX2CFP9_9BACI|nr:multidrug efflux MFS transporter [Bacillus cytotoxicus]QTR82525.1 multidrug efflux MFS transporter [Bacillus cytotoxicus]QTR86263.1 multidrug efflux MFS transporter [Bacillus cytotoxicus]SCL89874.1 Major facilitator superfamily MFS_1 [Bacillus cytotoxicus]
MASWKRNLMICWLGCFTTAAGMSLVIPFLSFYIEKLGVTGTSNIAQWSGIAFGVTFLMGAIVSPIWGKLGDTHGRKLMLIRASLGMAIIMTLMGFVTNVYQLVALRFLMGAVSGFLSTAMTFIAAETPKEHSGWAISTISTGGVSGSLLGPMLGGYLSELIGMRHVFFITGAFLFLSFLIVFFFLKEENRSVQPKKSQPKKAWTMVPAKHFIMSLFVATFIIQLANMSIQPIITLYVKHLAGAHTAHIETIAGAVMSATGLAVILAAPRLGRLSDHIGPQKTLIVALFVAGLVFIPQAFVTSAWQLLILRFLLGIAQAGLLPSVQTLLKKHTPNHITGRIFGYNQSFQFLGNMIGPVLGGQIAAHAGFQYVFFSTAALLFIACIWVYFHNRHAEVTEKEGLKVS